MKGESLGKRIKEARGSLTQDEFARAIGVSKISLSRYEHDERTPDAAVLIRICETYGIDPAGLLMGGTGDKTETNRNETINAMEAARRGDLIEAGTTEELLKQLTEDESSPVLRKRNTRLFRLLGIILASGDPGLIRAIEGDLEVLSESVEKSRELKRLQEIIKRLENRLVEK